MRIEDFLRRHGLEHNPFATAEEAQGDRVLERLLEERGFHFGHPQWPKFCGDPAGNQTSVVFGVKGSGKTAMRLALNDAVEAYNARRPDDQGLLINYDEFNPYLDAWRRKTAERLRRKRRWGETPAKPTLRNHWHLPHHMDAILAEAAKELPGLVARVEKPRAWDPQIRYDILYLAAAYLPAKSHEYRETLQHLYKTLFSPWRRGLNGLAHWGLTGLTLGLFHMFKRRGLAKLLDRIIETIEREPAERRWALQHIPKQYLRNEPEPRDPSEPDSEQPRYELIRVFLRIAGASGYSRVIVVIDKVDEPSMIQGKEDRMTEFIWPLWTNKLLQTSGVQYKMLLPAQLYNAIRKDDSLWEVMRPDKTNLINPLTWSGEHLYEMLSERAAVCLAPQAEARSFELRSLFDPSISREQLVQQLGRMAIPRFAAKFVHRALREACESLLAEDAPQEARPTIPVHAFHKVSADMETEIQTYRQTFRGE